MDFLKNNKRFSFMYGDKPFWDLNPYVKAAENGNSIEIEYTLPDGLKVTNIAKAYPDFDAYEWVTCFENTSEKPSNVISKLYDCDIEVPFKHKEPLGYTAFLPDESTDTKIYSPSGSTWSKTEFYCDMDEYTQQGYTNHIYPGNTKHYSCIGGRSSDKTAPFFNVFEENNGVIFAIGWTGQWNCDITRNADSVCIKTGLEDTCFKLYPGEKIRTSSFTVMNYRDCDYQDSQNKWRRLLKAHFSPIGKPGFDKQLPFCAGLWGGMSTDGMLERINIIKENKLPFEYIWIDAGWYGTSTQDSPDEFEGDWYSYAGDWRINTHIHPDSMEKVSRAVKDAGLKLLLWFEPERALPHMPVPLKHPEYFLSNPNTGDESLLLNLGYEPAWQYCFDTIAEIIEKLDIKFYRQDFNFMPLEIWRAHDGANRKGITEIKHIMGMYRLWDALMEKFPGLLVDNCSSGGRRIDIETLKRSVPLWRSDYQCPANFIIEVSQTHNVSFGTWIPYSGTGSGRAWGDVYKLRSSYAAGLTTNFTFSEKSEFGEPEQIEWIKKYGEEYKKVRPYMSCDMYQLTDFTDSNTAWAAAQYNSPETRDGIVQVFRRPDSPCTCASFTLRGLDKNKTYVFTDADDGSEITLKGSEKFEVKINKKRTAKLYFYRAQ